MTAIIYFRYLRYLTRLYLARSANLPPLLVPAHVEVEINSPKIGLFAQLTWCVKLAAAAERRHHRIHFVCTSKNYSPDGGDWLEGVLRQRVNARPTWPWLKVRLTDIEDFPFGGDPGLRLTIPIARAVFDRTFSFAPEVIAGVRKEQSEWRPGKLVIGVHYRGTDKSLEAVRVPPAQVLDALDELGRRFAGAGEKRSPSYFVATDENSFLQAMQQRFGSENILTNSTSERSVNGSPVHLTEAPSLQRVRDAMIDSLLLASCPIVFRTSSFLSGWAAVFAERQYVVALNEPHAACSWFPDREVSKIAYKAEDLSPLFDAIRRDGIANLATTTSYASRYSQTLTL